MSKLVSSSPSRAVPPGRMGYDLDADDLLLHTIQHKAVWEVLESTGRLTGPTLGSPLVDPDFAHAYEWMAEQMADRGMPCPAGHLPVWAWARQQRRALVSNLRSALRYEDSPVLLTLRVPRERVLLSDLDSWTIVLNSSPFVPNDEALDFTDRLDDAYARLESLDPRWQTSEWTDLDPRVLSFLKDSWKTFLDLGAFRPGYPVQACLPHLLRSDVLEACRLVRE